MIRMLLLLCAGIYVTLQVGGQDRGQLRFGLMEAPDKPAPFTPVDAAVTTSVAAAPAPVAAEAAVMPVVFAPAQAAAVTPVVAEAAEARLQPEPAVQRVQAEVPVAAQADSGAAVMYVTGRSVNVRSGPSTRNAVVGRLTRGEAVTVVSDDGNGWARVRIEGDGIDGFMATSFLAESP
ncbi:SH3 domain-containing protein [Pseudotabrizicola algicola]|uniref:SH3 domain-containing protein n=1 Tax=Pseudotabrizicola algicola TaxID=2709381 RepID=A0A6B3RPB0_9RHOB|nr:SH3 domain-containing protein [Pseudotabrizicola algicola]NEX45905.1 SH3 domain-containing protein [Pseudotabrizicola algicola]